MEGNKKSSRPFTVVVEGNIGSGKTTFLSHFSKAAGLAEKVEVLSEPVSKWRDVGGHNLLQLMYEDPKRWAHPFQSYVQLTMLQLHSLQTDKPVKMLERSIYSAKECFVENLFRSGVMHQAEYAVYQEWYKYLTAAEGASRLNLDVDLIVYVRTRPEVAWQRVKSRARAEEKVIPLKYLQELHDLHENWLMGDAENSAEKRLPAPLLVIDNNDDLAADPEAFAKQEQKIFAHVHKAKQINKEEELKTKTASAAVEPSPRKALSVLQ